MDNLKTTSNLVMHILQIDEYSRNSDNILYYKVLKHIGNQNGIDIDKMSVPHFFLHLKQYGFPQFESVRRTRQKIQASHPELAGNDKTQACRMLNEEKYREYARGNV